MQVINAYFLHLSIYFIVLCLDRIVFYIFVPITEDNISFMEKRQEEQQKRKPDGQEEKNGFPKWVEYLRKDIFTYSQKQFVEFLLELLEEAKKDQGDQKINMRYMAGLEKHGAKTVRIDVLEQLLKCLGFDFDKITEFFENAREVARCVRKFEGKLLKSEDDKKYPFYAFIERRPTPENPKNADEILSGALLEYIETLVYIPPEEFGKNRIIDMQSLNFFWTYAAIEYIIERQGRQPLTDKTKNAIQETINDSIQLINHCKYIYIELTQNISQEAINEFDSVIAEMGDTRNESQFSEIKKKDVQLEYKTELRKMRIFCCVIDLCNLLIDNIIDDIKKQDYNLAELNEIANILLKIPQSLRTYINTGKFNDSDQDKMLRTLLGENMLDIIYQVACSVEQAIDLICLMRKSEN